MKNNANIWTIIFLIVAGQGLFLSVFLFFKRSSFRRSNFFLAFLLLLFSLNLIENVALWTGCLIDYPHFTNTTLGFVYLYGPLFYFFVGFRINKDIRLKGIDFLHLIPFLLFTYRMLEFFSLSGEVKLRFLKNQQAYLIDFWTYFWQAAVPILLLTYLVFAYLKAVKNKLELSSLRKIFISFALFSLNLAAYFVINILMDLNIEFDYLVMLVISLFIYQIGYYALAVPSIFDPSLYRKKSRTKYEKSALSRGESLKHLRNFRKIMDADKLYLNRNLKISEVARLLSISTNHLSQTLNEHNNKSFNEIINYYRVEEAKKMLLSIKYENFTIEGIALESGFNNKASFNKYFKKFTNMTLKEFKLSQTH